MARSYKKNKVKASILGYYYYIRGVEKSGKTTLFYDLNNALFGTQDKGLLISMGKEDGYKALPDIQVEVIDDTTKVENGKKKTVKTAWKNFVELVDDLVADRDENGIELLGIDTYDEFCKISSREVVRLSNVETPTKQCKSINGAFGGYSGGFDKFDEIVEEQLHRLRKVGYTVFVISHTKVKTIKEKGMGEDESYQMLTTNLDSRLDNVISHKADVIATIQIDKDVKDGKLNGTNRYIYFRESNFVKAGSRFKEIVERTELSADNFIKAVEDGIKKSMRNNISDEAFEKQKEKDEEERQVIAEQSLQEEKQIKTIDVDRNTEIKEIITTKWKTLSKEVKEQAKEIMKNNEIDKLGDIENNPTSAMEEILNLIQ